VTAASALEGCMAPTRQAAGPTVGFEARSGKPDYDAIYAAMPGDKFPVPAVKYAALDPKFLRQDVDWSGREGPGTIVVDPKAHVLFHVLPGGRATRYGVGVGKEGFAWSGSAEIRSKQEWPDWYPPKEMIKRRPDIKPQLAKLQSGVGVKGGTENPLGARAMYLWQGNRDTLFRIHGTLEPETIGTSVSSGCIRMINQDVMDLYARTPVGTRVVVLT
jgi:lipoprotein-anchoring transpeptidase ErfK/SrfK